MPGREAPFFAAWNMSTCGKLNLSIAHLGLSRLFPFPTLALALFRLPKGLKSYASVEKGEAPPYPVLSALTFPLRK